MHGRGPRYYGVETGRFLTPHPGWIKTADPEDPKSWNGYGYVDGDLVDFIDPEGFCSVFIGGITYPGLNWYQSTESVIAQASGLMRLQGSHSRRLRALRQNSGYIVIVAYSGGPAAFTAADALLSPDQQARIGLRAATSAPGPGSIGPGISARKVSVN